MSDGVRKMDDELSGAQKKHSNKSRKLTIGSGQAIYFTFLELKFALKARFSSCQENRFKFMAECANRGKFMPLVTNMSQWRCVVLCCDECYDDGNKCSEE